jgi:hypothetical protein
MPLCHCRQDCHQGNLPKLLEAVWSSWEFLLATISDENCVYTVASGSTWMVDGVSVAPMHVTM